jgi:hypothetical protein
MRNRQLSLTKRRGGFPSGSLILSILPIALWILIAGDRGRVANKNELLVQAFQVHHSSHRNCQTHYPKVSQPRAAKWQRFGHPFGAPDPPLSALVQLPDQFLLSSTPENYIPLEDGQRLVCLGDVHGDYQALVDFLDLAGVLDFQSRKECVNGDDDGVPEENSCDSFKYSALPEDVIPIWTGENTIVVQCGDILDRGSEELACYQLLAQLSHQAESQGGRVICLFGNHEALNAMGLFQYATTDAEYERVVGKMVDDQLTEHFQGEPPTTPRAHLFHQQQQQQLQQDKEENGNEEDTSNTGTPIVGWRAQYVENQPSRWATYEPNGLLARSLLANMKIAVQVGRTVCVHAGLTAEQLQENGGIVGLNDEARAYILGNTLRNPVAYNNQGYYASPQQSWIDAERRQSTYINSIPNFLGGGAGVSSPVWMRDYSSPADGPPRNKDAMSMIDKALEEVGDCDRMVMGHTVQSQINAALDGKAWRIDVGASRGVIAGKPEVLEIVNVNGTEVVSVLTKYGKRPGSERHVWAMADFF